MIYWEQVHPSLKINLFEGCDIWYWSAKSWAFRQGTNFWVDWSQPLPESQAGYELHEALVPAANRSHSYHLVLYGSPSPGMVSLALAGSSARPLFSVFGTTPPPWWDERGRLQAFLNRVRYLKERTDRHARKFPNDHSACTDFHCIHCGLPESVHVSHYSPHSDYDRLYREALRKLPDELLFRIPMPDHWDHLTAIEEDLKARIARQPPILSRFDRLLSDEPV